jgi:hypothetical protein
MGFLYMKPMQLLNFVYSLFCFVLSYVVPTLSVVESSLMLFEALVFGVFCGVFISLIKIILIVLTSVTDQYE